MIVWTDDLMDEMDVQADGYPIVELDTPMTEWMWCLV